MKPKLKPVYESVAAGEVKVGDVVKDSFYWDEPYEVKKITDGEHGWFKLNGDDSKDFTPEDELLGKLPDRRHPEVLMRALRIIIVGDLLLEDLRDGYFNGHPDKERREVEIVTRVNEAIDAALKEIESEDAK